SMDGDEQVSFNASGFLYAYMQRYEEVVVACHVGAHIGLRVDQFFQFAGNCQHYIFFMCATWAAGAWIFATMSGIERNQNGLIAFGGRSGRGCCRCGSDWR